MRDAVYSQGCFGIFFVLKFEVIPRVGEAGVVLYCVKCGVTLWITIYKSLIIMGDWNRAVCKNTKDGV